MGKKTGSLFLMDAFLSSSVIDLGKCEKEYYDLGFEYATIPCENCGVVLFIVFGKVENGIGVVPCEYKSPQLQNLDPEIIFGRLSYSEVVDGLNINTEHMQKPELWRAVEGVYTNTNS